MISKRSATERLIIAKTLLESVLQDMPSAQPEERTNKRTETRSCDLISRQAAIEINQSYHGQMPNEVNHSIWKEINDLPSAQPEIIRCRECKHWREDHTCREHSLVSPMMAYEFCSRAERREE